jgi:hypothetical protein
VHVESSLDRPLAVFGPRQGSERHCRDASAPISLLRHVDAVPIGRRRVLA